MRKGEDQFRVVLRPWFPPVAFRLRGFSYFKIRTRSMPLNICYFNRGKSFKLNRRDRVESLGVEPKRIGMVRWSRRFLEKGRIKDSMADEKLSRRNFLSGIGATAAASALPLSEIRSLMVRPKEPRPDAAAGSFDIAIESDLRGNLLGTVSRDAGKTPVIGAIVEIHGDSPLGVWTRQCRSERKAFSRRPRRWEVVERLPWW